MILHDLITVPWIILVAYWTVGALKTRTTVRQESFASRYAVMLLVFPGYVLLFSDTAGVGVLGRHFLRRATAISVVGVVLTWLGIAIALWARYNLGQYWSARITLKEDHQLIRTGPYAHLRHPIYSGLDLAAVGSALVIDRWRCVLGVCLMVVGHVIKAKREESLLAEQFGEVFDEHRKQTGFLIPRLW